jgi:hypothetical protein
MQSPCAHHVPNYTAQALRARDKRSVVLPHAFGLPAIVAGWTWCATSTASAVAASTATTMMHSPTHRRRAENAAYAWRPRRMLRSHDRQRASRKLSVHAVALCSPCAHHVPHYTAQALRARGKRAVVLPRAFGLPAIVAGWTWCATSTASAAAASTPTTTMHSPAHRRLRQALRRQRCTARPLFTRPASPRRTLRSHDNHAHHVS